jgi:hypothetical protein
MTSNAPKNKDIFKIACLLMLVVIPSALNVYSKRVILNNFYKKIGHEGITRKAKIIEKEISFFNLSDYKRKDVSTILIDFKASKEDYGQITYRYSDRKQRVMEAKAYLPKDLFKTVRLGDEIDILYDPDKTERSIIKSVFLQKHKEYVSTKLLS